MPGWPREEGKALRGHPVPLQKADQAMQWILLAAVLIFVLWMWFRDGE